MKRKKRGQNGTSGAVSPLKTKHLTKATQFQISFKTEGELEPLAPIRPTQQSLSLSLSPSFSLSPINL